MVINTSVESITIIDSESGNKCISYTMICVFFLMNTRF